MTLAVRLALPVKAFVELVLLDDEAFMLTFGYEINTVMGLNIKYQAVAIHFDEFNVCGDFKPWRCCSFMADIDMGADALFIGPVQMRIYAQNTGPFQETHEESGGKNFRHLNKFVRFRVQSGYGFGNRNDKLVAKSEAGSERVFHDKWPVN